MPHQATLGHRRVSPTSALLFIVCVHTSVLLEWCSTNIEPASSEIVRLNYLRNFLVVVTLSTCSSAFEYLLVCGIEVMEKATRKVKDLAVEV